MPIKPRLKSKFFVEEKPNHAIITIPFHKNYYAIIIMPLSWSYCVNCLNRDWFDFLDCLDFYFSFCFYLLLAESKLNI